MKRFQLATLVVALFLAIAVSRVHSQSQALDGLVTDVGNYTAQVLQNPNNGDAVSNLTNTLNSLVKALQSGQVLSQDNINALGANLKQLAQVPQLSDTVKKVTQNLGAALGNTASNLNLGS